VDVEILDEGAVGRLPIFEAGSFVVWPSATGNKQKHNFDTNDQHNLKHRESKFELSIDAHEQQRCDNHKYAKDGYSRWRY
jgi:hypothetical protein